VWHVIIYLASMIMRGMRWERRKTKKTRLIHGCCLVCCAIESRGGNFEAKATFTQQKTGAHHAFRQLSLVDETEREKMKLLGFFERVALHRRIMEELSCVGFGVVHSLCFRCGEFAFW